METKEIVLITGANGEIGHALIPKLAELKLYDVIALDIHELDDPLKPLVHEAVVADILDEKILENILKEHDITTIFHLAAILSTSGEKNPELAQSVNVVGTSKLLQAANSISLQKEKTTKFMFPSSIAIYGVPNLETKIQVGKIKENQYNNPITMYGINKLYCELLGNYYASNYKLLDPRPKVPAIDFRSLRFPGIISALTIPSGGTSDYAPEMIHAAARGEGYESFVRQDSTIPFMTMPDAVKALLMLTNSPKERLTRTVYNIAGFSVKTEEIAKLVNKVFPDSAISYNPDNNRQKIVDSWPADVDDMAARTDWGWLPDYDINKSFNDYLIPEIKNRYKESEASNPTS